MKIRENSRLKCPAALAFWAAVAASLLLLKIITPETFTGYDGTFYQAMSRELFSNNPRTLTAPYCYRIFPAFLLHFVPLDPLVSYSIFNAVAYAAAAGLFFSLFRGLGYSLREAGMGVFFFLFSWITVRFGFFYPAQIDPAYYLVLAAAFYAAYRGRDGLFLAALLFGALTREYFVILLPVYFFAPARNSVQREEGSKVQRFKSSTVQGNYLARALLLAALPIIVFAALRIALRPANTDFSYAGHLREFTRLFFLSGRRIAHSYFNVYGVLAFIVLLHLPVCLRFLFRNPALLSYLALSTLVLIVGGADRCRINAVAFPVFLILGLEAMKARREIYSRPLMIAFLVLSHLYLNRILRPMAAANYRRIWWSEVSFCPEKVFRSSSLTYLAVFLAFVLLYLILSLRARRATKL